MVADNLQYTTTFRRTVHIYDSQDDRSLLVGKVHPGEHREISARARDVRAATR